MTTANKIIVIDNRIELLKSRQNQMNGPIIKKLERKKRALLAQK